MLNGKIVTGKLTKLAVQRHYNDLKTGPHRGLFFCEESAWRVLNTFNYLKHSKGEWAGRPVELEPWQCWIIATVFGWKHTETDLRRFRVAYEEVGRKNGKTTKLAGIGLYGLTKDNEGGPEIYSAATKRDQSKILFDEACRMVKQSPPLRKRLDIQTRFVTNSRNFGKFMPLSADADSMDGLNPHYALVDELHAHKTSAMWDVLMSAFGARAQPLLYTITTSGFDKNGICYSFRDYIVKILTGVIEDDSTFGIIFTIDEDDDWRDETCWIKANPNLGVSVKLDYLRKQAQKAAVMPTAKVNFLTKHLDVWVTGESIWCNIEEWLKCGSDYTHDDLSNAIEVYLGLDLSSVSDITSIGGVAIMSDGRWRAFSKSYLPEDVVTNNFRKTNIPFLQWSEDGWLTLTPGNVVDYNWIKADIMNLMEHLPVKSIAFDRWNSSQLVNDLLEIEAPMVAHGMGYASMSAPMKEFERRYLSKQIEHNNNPVLNWAMSNVVADQDPAGNIKPAKDKSSEKIDPAVAVMLAVSRAMLVNEDQNIDDFIFNPISL